MGPSTKIYRPYVQRKVFPYRKGETVLNYVEHWMSVDQMTLMQQLGALPEPA